MKKNQPDRRQDDLDVSLGLLMRLNRKLEIVSDILEDGDVDRHSAGLRLIVDDMCREIDDVVKRVDQ